MMYVKIHGAHYDHLDVPAILHISLVAPITPPAHVCHKHHKLQGNLSDYTVFPALIQGPV